VIGAIPTEARGPKRKVGRAPCRACCLPQSIEPGQVHTPQELFCRALLGQRARGRLHHAGQVQAGRVVRGGLAGMHADAPPPFHSITEGLEVEFQHEDSHAASCHVDHGNVSRYRAQILQSMCAEGDDILPLLRAAATCSVDVAAFAVPEFHAGSQTLDLSKFRICGFAYLANSEGQKQAVCFCSCCEKGAQAWRAVVLHHHEAHFDNVCGELKSLSSKCVHACAILDICRASDSGLEGAIRSSMLIRPGDDGILHSLASSCVL
jgi:hypothetical protein